MLLLKAKSITLNFEKGISGRYVNVVIPGDNKVLTLCEVEVYSYPTPDGIEASIDKSNPTLFFECKGMEGRYINIVIPGKNEFLILYDMEHSSVKLAAALLEEFNHSTFSYRKMERQIFYLLGVITVAGFTDASSMKALSVQKQISYKTPRPRMQQQIT
ncbi:hypothetical protein MHYP_G00288600 [Metynnis hypsauchen]